jgi:hypothetical protein
MTRTVAVVTFTATFDTSDALASFKRRWMPELEPHDARGLPGVVSDCRQAKTDQNCERERECVPDRGEAQQGTPKTFVIDFF